MEKEQHIKYLIGLVYIGLAFAAIVLVIDYQMKQQILRESMAVRGRIKILDEIERLNYGATWSGIDRPISDDSVSGIDSVTDDSGMEAGRVASVDGSEDEHATE